jgi:hypothetical protein
LTVDREEFDAEGRVILDELLRECAAFVAEHYVHDPDGSVLGTWSDPEFVWSAAVDDTIGPDEFWDAFDADTVATAADATDEQASRWVTRVIHAGTVMLQAGLRVAEGEETFPANYSVEWCAFQELVAQGRDPSLLLRATPAFGLLHDLVGFYLVNGRGGVMDATFAFYEVDDVVGESPFDLDEEEPEEDV